MRSTLMLSILLIFSHCFMLAQEKVSATQLQEDYKILKQALEELHPALYKYDSKAQREKDFEALQASLSTDQSPMEAYKNITEFTAKIKCGHTYTNFWNQKKIIRDSFIKDKNKVPFTFRIIDEEIYIYQNLSENPELKKGDKVLSINGHSSEEILNKLIPLTKTDGNNRGQKLFDLQVSGVDNFEAFDIYFPLLFEVDEAFEVEVEKYNSDEKKLFSLSSLTRKERYDILTERYGKQVETFDDYWDFKILDGQTAVLTLGTFVTWKMELKWKQFLKDAFAQLKKENIQHLVIDIRGNAGGNSDVQETLISYITDQPSQKGPFQQTLKTQVVSEEIRPYLYTWRKGMKFNVKPITKPLDNGFYTFKIGGMIDKKISPSSKAYDGKVYVLAGAYNSSATFFLLNYLKQNKLATLIGQESGGNLQGITGGQIFFLNLPHSKVEVDIPLIGYYPPEARANEGIKPDVYVKPTVEDMVNGVDAEMEAALELIMEKESSK